MTHRKAPLNLDPATFRTAGHRLVDDVADFLENIATRPVAPGLTPSEIRKRLPDRMPEEGADAGELLAEASQLLFETSTLNGHPRFFGYITSSAAPIGILGDFLASAINPNVGGWAIAPAATEIELQTLRWVADLIGYPADSGGVFVSGGNMANIVCLLAARAAFVAKQGGHGQVDQSRLRLYTSVDTHTWIEKAVDIAGLGPDCIRLIPVERDRRMSITALEQAIAADRSSGLEPFLLIGTAGSTNTGSIDPLATLADIAARERLWYHVDGAYGAPAAALPEAPADLHAIGRADSAAVDPHKWLYSPLEAACAFVRREQDLTTTFSHKPPYYHFEDSDDERRLNFYEFGPQNSRGFRALKVWLAFRQVGRAGHERMIREDIALTRKLFEAVSATEELEALTCDLSIATFAYVPRGLDYATADEAGRDYLNRLNDALLLELQDRGEVFLSNAVIDGRFLLRACIVNFRTSESDVSAVPDIVVRTGRKLHAEMSREASRATASGVTEK